jgi:hypothetical protein
MVAASISVVRTPVKIMYPYTVTAFAAGYGDPKFAATVTGVVAYSVRPPRMMVH